MGVLLAENAERKSAEAGLTDSKPVKNWFHVKLGWENQGGAVDREGGGFAGMFHVNHLFAGGSMQVVF
jgi:hypothetical protein